MLHETIQKWSILQNLRKVKIKIQTDKIDIQVPHFLILFPLFPSLLTCTNPASFTARLILRYKPKGCRDQTLPYGVLERLLAYFIQKAKEKTVSIQKTKELTIYINAARACEVEVNSNLLVHFHGKSYEDQCLLNLPTTGSLSVQCLLKSPLKCVVSHLKKCFVFLSFQAQVKPLSYKRG